MWYTLHKLQPTTYINSFITSINNMSFSIVLLVLKPNRGSVRKGILNLDGGRLIHQKSPGPMEPQRYLQPWQYLLLYCILKCCILFWNTTTCVNIMECVPKGWDKAFHTDCLKNLPRGYQKYLEMLWVAEHVVMGGEKWVEWGKEPWEFMYDHIYTSPCLSSRSSFIFSATFAFHLTMTFTVSVSHHYPLFYHIVQSNVSIPQVGHQWNEGDSAKTCCGIQRLHKPWH